MYEPEGFIRPEVQQWFSLVDKDGSGQITATELKAALANGKGGTFSESACRLMISMFGKKQSGFLDLQEFQEVFKYINSWIDFLRNIDLDQSGSIQEYELNAVLEKMGYKISPTFVQFLIKKCDPINGQSMSVDQFIVFCIQLEKFTGAFKSRDTERTGTISIGFEDFLMIAFDCSFN
ncbi:PREDICTED: peflin [Polistes dominula]|uniref:Peflin n=1 Tax=Polistes dominula TaxID=743375 RepID=A0ABM1I095_POLDO|nr:PREDICTED: peflin [Polistes dominula]XP_015173632.1 PREDICTED: peflin [Polistes dominula]